MPEGVTYKDVEQAAEQLVAEAKTPTIERVRAMLGRGSNSTIGPHLKYWKEASANAGAASRLPDPVLAAAKAVHESVQATADERIAKAQTAADARIGAQAADAAQRIEQLEVKHQALETAHQALQTQHDELTRTHEALSEAHTKLNETYDGVRLEHAKAGTQIEALEHSLAGKDEEIARLQQTLKSAQDSFEEYTRESRAMREEAATVAEARVSALEAAVRDAHSHKDDLMTSLANQERDLRAVREELKTASERAGIAERDSQLAKAAEKQAERRSETAEGRVEALEKRVANLVEEGKRLQVKWDAEREETTALREANSVLKDDISSLREEKARLAGLLEHSTREAVPKE